MSTQYPTMIDDNISLPVAVDNNTIVDADEFNNLRGAIIAIEGAIGIKPGSVYGSARQRLDAIETILTGLSVSGGGISLGGDLAGNNISQTVIGLQGNPISSNAPTSGELLTWDSVDGYWAPAPAPIGFAIRTFEISFMSGLFSTKSSTLTRAGARKFDITPYPVSIGTLNRTVKFVVDIDKTNGATSVEVLLYDSTALIGVAGTDLISTNNANTEITSAALTVGTSNGNIKGTSSQYELQIKMNGGGPADAVFITNARLLITYA